MIFQKAANFQQNFLMNSRDSLLAPKYGYIYETYVFQAIGRRVKILC